MLQPFATEIRYQTLAFLTPGLILPTLRRVSLQINPGTDFAALAKVHQAGKDDYVDRLNQMPYLSGKRKASANDLLDMSRIAVALNDAAVLLCDTAMSEMIKQSKVQEILQDVKVFSMKQRDEAAEYIAKL